MDEHFLAREDARLRAGFQKEQFPTMNGKPFPPGDPSDIRAGRQLAFLNAYYDLNRAYFDLLEYRSNEAKAKADTAMERLLMQAAEAALLVVENLDAHYRKIGLIATPNQVDGCIVDVVFHDAISALEDRQCEQSGTTMSSAYFRVPRIDEFSSPAYAAPDS